MKPDIMKSLRKFDYVWAVVLSLGLVPVPQTSFALGFRIPNQDAEAIGRGNAFVATADNPSAIYYNPAGITQLEGNHVQLGSLFYLGMQSHYDAINSSGRDVTSDYQVVPVPEFYYTYKPKDCPLSAGLGVYTPFGLSLKWPENASFRDSAIEGAMTYATINPVVAYQILPSLSVSMGPTFNWSDLKLRKGLVSTPGLGDEFVFRGNNWGYGFNAGIRWQPSEQWAFGASYRSASDIDYKGETKLVLPLGMGSASSSSSSEIKFPQIVIAGVSYRPTPAWNIEVNVDWADWNVVDDLTFKNTPVGDQSMQLQWASSWFYQAGVTRYFGPYYVSLGYFFSENTTSERYFTSLLPDTDLHVPSVGFGYKGEHWDLALAGQLIFTGPAREVRNSVNSSVNGDYQRFLPTVTVSTGYHF
jgi:long-chain fatty acid transport protein